MTLFVDLPTGTIQLQDNMTLDQINAVGTTILRVVDNDPFSVVKQINNENVVCFILFLFPPL